MICFYSSIDETDWSIQMAEDIFNNEFDCPGCSQIFNLTNIQKLQHTSICKPVQAIIPEQETTSHESSKPSSSNQKKYDCKVCFKKLYMTNIEILKHRKSCKIKVERE